MKKDISNTSRSLLFLAAAFLIVTLFVPIWSIYLDAPQYPEGLSLQIWANKIAGDVDIINGLNHYIGMKTLHTDDFIEFTILPYLIGGYAILFIIAALIRRKKWLYTVLIAFIVFGIAAMIDFWLWEYDYGHNLDPNAAIKVPGMAYQPPLIGFKQLLNFGAYSIPDIGGWLFVSAGLLLVIAVFIERKRSKKMKNTILPMLICLLLLSACSSDGPSPIQYNKDACDFCKMSISENKFAAELITTKGRVYKFDDIICMLQYNAEHKEPAAQKFYVSNFSDNHDLIDATTAVFVKDENLRSPMGGNIAAFDNYKAASEYAGKSQTNTIEWKDLAKIIDTGNPHHEH